MAAWEKEFKDYVYYLKLEKKLSDNTVEAYLRDLRQAASYMQSEFSISAPEKVGEEHVTSFLAHLYDRGAEKSTQARILSGIRSSSTRPSRAANFPTCFRSVKSGRFWTPST